MLSFRTVLPQYQLSSHNVQKKMQKILDTHSFADIITQQLRRKVCLRPEKRAAFLFKQQHHYFFSSFFADGTSGASVFTFTHRRCFTALGIFCALGMQKHLNCKHNHNIALYRSASPVAIFDSG